MRDMIKKFALLIIIGFTCPCNVLAAQESTDSQDGIYFNWFSDIPDIVFESQNIQSAGFHANISMIVNQSGTFTSFYDLLFLQNDRAISKQSHHAFYTPADTHTWREYFNVSNFYYLLHSLDPTVDEISLTWQYGIPPQHGSTYGERTCHHGKPEGWTCVRQNCYGCSWTHGWLLCEGHLNCSGEETTWIYENEAGCRNKNRSTMILCANGNEGVVMADDIVVFGRRNFSFWTVAKHRLRKLFGKVV